MVSLERFSAAQHAAWVVDFLAGQHWPFHAGAADRDTVEERLRSGYFDGPDRATLIVLDGSERVGLARVEDLGDPTPVLDLRIDSRHRGRGLGTAALRELIRWVFGAYEVDRIEGMTRQDNVAMRRAFRSAGFVKEAHHRHAWPTEVGVPLDAVGYALLRSDWETGGTTPVAWHDEPEEPSTR